MNSLVNDLDEPSKESTDAPDDGLTETPSSIARAVDVTKEAEGKVTNERDAKETGMPDAGVTQAEATDDPHR